MATARNYFKDTEATFKGVPPRIGRQLARFAVPKNIGKTVKIDGETYTLDHVSAGSNSFFRSRGFSAYYRVKKSIVRVSDHWSRSNGAPKSRKLNCLRIGSCVWNIDNRVEDIFETAAWMSGKWDYRLIVGRCGLASMKRSSVIWENHE